jgi:transcriptional regulator with XRE-family HTH domain
MDIIDRINKLIADNKMSEREFATKIGMGQRSVNYYLKREQKPSLEFIINIIKTFPNISSGWLLTGKGSIEVSENPVSEINIDYKDKYTEVLEENRKLNKEIKVALEKASVLKDKIIALLEEREEIKNELAAGVSDVIIALTKTAS